MGKNYVALELKLWENDELDVIRTSSIGDASNKDNGAERNIAIEAGYQYVEFTFAKSLAGTYAVGFNFGSAKSLYVYEIVLIA